MSANQPVTDINKAVELRQVNGRQVLAINLDALAEQSKEKPKPSVDNPLALSEEFEWTQPDVGEIFSNLEIICQNDERITADRALLARISQPLFEKLTKEPRISELDMSEFSLQTIKFFLNYLVHGDAPEVELCKCNSLNGDKNCTIVELIQMAQKYQMERLLTDLKMRFIAIKQVRQFHFDLDKQYQLGLRQYFLQVFYHSLDVPQTTIFTDPLIYKEIGNFIFKIPMTLLDHKVILRRRQCNFVVNLQKAGLHYDNLEFDLTGCPIALALYITETCLSTTKFQYLSFWLSSGKLIADSQYLEHVIKSAHNSANKRIQEGKRIRSQMTEVVVPKAEEEGSAKKNKVLVDQFTPKQ